MITKIMRFMMPAAVFSACLLAQAPAIGFSPVPLWPQYGDTSLYPGQYVFFHLDEQDALDALKLTIASLQAKP